MSALAERYVPGHAFSASAISEINQRLDEPRAAVHHDVAGSLGKPVERFQGIAEEGRLADVPPESRFYTGNIGLARDLTFDDAAGSLLGNLAPDCPAGTYKPCLYLSATNGAPYTTDTFAASGPRTNETATQSTPTCAAMLNAGSSGRVIARSVATWRPRGARSLNARRRAPRTTPDAASRRRRAARRRAWRGMV